MLKASRRSAVEPFLAMDVLAAAAELEAAGRNVDPHGGGAARARRRPGPCSPPPPRR